MRYAIVSDIHGNATALEKALEDADARKVDKVICLGDVAGYGPDSSRCIEIVKERCEHVVLGNHEAGICGRLGLSWYSDTARNGILRDRGRISHEDKDWMRGLPYIKKINDRNGKFICAHGTTAGDVEDFGYIQDGFDAGLAMQSQVMDSESLLFVGHTHFASIFESPVIVKDNLQDGLPRYYAETDVEETQTFQLKDGLKYVVNVGSVGYPRVQHFTCYAIYDSRKKTVEHRVLDFDFKGYVAEMKAKEIPLPGWLEYHVRKMGADK